MMSQARNDLGPLYLPFAFFGDKNGIAKLRDLAGFLDNQKFDLAGRLFCALMVDPNCLIEHVLTAFRLISPHLVSQEDFGYQSLYKGTKVPGGPSHFQGLPVQSLLSSLYRFAGANLNNSNYFKKNKEHEKRIKALLSNDGFIFAYLYILSKARKSLAHSCSNAPAPHHEEYEEHLKQGEACLLAFAAPTFCFFKTGPSKVGIVLSVACQKGFSPHDYSYLDSLLRKGQLRHNELQAETSVSEHALNLMEDILGYQELTSIPISNSNSNSNMG